MRRILPLILLLTTLLASGAMAKPVENPKASQGKPLIVGFSTTSLEVLRNENPRWLKSYADFWNLIAQELKRPYVLKAMPFEDVLKALDSGAIDITAVPLIVTAEREDRFDMSIPLGGGRPAVAMRHRIWDHPWLSAVRIFLSWGTFKLALILLAALAAVGTVVWLVERRENDEHFGQGPARGIGTGVYWAGSTLASGICLGIGLRTPLGRVLGLFWMIVCVMAFSAVIASLTYYLTAQQYTLGAFDTTSLNQMRLGAFKGSVQPQMIEKTGPLSLSCESTEVCIKALLGKKIDGFLYDEGYLRYFSETRYRGKISVYPTEVRPYRRAFAMPKESALRKPFNMALLEVMDRPVGEALINQLDLSQYLRARPLSPLEEKRRFGAGRGRR